MGSGSVAKVMLDDVSRYIFLWPTARRSMPARSSCAGDNRYLVLAGLAAGNRDAGVLAFGSVVLVLARQRSEDMVSVIIRRASRLARRLLSSCRHARGENV